MDGFLWFLTSVCILALKKDWALPPKLAKQNRTVFLRGRNAFAFIQESQQIAYKA